MKRGFLAVIEGIDGAGKSTQARSLVRKLRSLGMEAAYFREPSRGRWGRELKRKAKTAGSLTPEEELELFQRDRRENVEKNLKPALSRGKVVVLDRYYFSTIAYQGAKGLDREKIRRMNRRFAPEPDLVFILDIGAGEGLSRIAGRKTKDALFEKKAYLRKVGRIFRGFRGRPFVHLDGRRSREDIRRLILEETLGRLKKAARI
jgi:dTMP kinase